MTLYYSKSMLQLLVPELATTICSKHTWVTHMPLMRFSGQPTLKIMARPVMSHDIPSSRQGPLMARAVPEYFCKVSAQPEGPYHKITRIFGVFQGSNSPLSENLADALEASGTFAAFGLMHLA